MTKTKHVWFVLLIPLLLWGCNDCEDCELPVSAPRTSFVFINQTSLDTLTAQLATLDTALSQLATEATVLSLQNTSLDSLLDSLSARIDRGLVELREDSTSTANLIEANNELLASNTESQASLTTERTTLNTTITTIESGNLLVDTVTNLATGNAVIFSDSASVYVLPLDPNFNEMNYAFSILSQAYDLTVTYETTTSQNARRNVLVGAESISFSATTFREVQVVSTESNNPHGSTALICFF